MTEDNDPRDHEPLCTETGEPNGPHESKQLTLIEPLGPALAEDVAWLRLVCSGAILPIPTPWASLNGPLDGGWWPEPTVLVGTPGGGKTQLALQALLCAAQQPRTAGLYVSLEMPRVQVSTRTLAILGKFSWSDLYRGREPSLLAKAQSALPTAERLPLYQARITHDGWHYGHLAGAAQEALQHSGAAKLLMIVDFLQLVSGEEREDLRSTITHAVYAGVHAIQESRGALSIIYVSSAARDKYPLLDEADRLPQHKHYPVVGSAPPKCFQGVGKESGDIEYGAAQVLTLCHDANGKPWLAIAKARTKTTAWVELDFDGTLFTEPETGSEE